MPPLFSNASDLLTALCRTSANDRRRRLKKVVIVGDKHTGKTAILRKLPATKTSFKDDIFVYADRYEVELKYDNVHSTVVVWDDQLAGVRASHRELIYSRADLVVVCYAIDSMDSLFSVQSKWLPEARQYCPGVPVLLAANKKDVRENKALRTHLQSWGERLISEKEGKLFSSRMEVDRFVECSTVEKDGLNDLLKSVAVTLFDSRRLFERCTILSLQI